MIDTKALGYILATVYMFDNRIKIENGKNDSIR